MRRSSPGDDCVIVFTPGAAPFKPRQFLDLVFGAIAVKEAAELRPSLRWCRGSLLTPG
jgi:hypothetical protein